MKSFENVEAVNTYTSSLKKRNGITLIALVITIIILLILAGITLSTLTGDNGLFTRAKQAKQNTLDAQERENLAIGSYENTINEVIGGSSREPVNEDSENDSNILFDGKQSTGTITFDKNLFDYEYIEFIMGIEKELGSGDARIFSTTVSRDALMLPYVNGDHYVVASGSYTSGIFADLTKIDSNSISFVCAAVGASWGNSHTGYIYKIIGRNSI